MRSQPDCGDSGSSEEQPGEEEEVVMVNIGGVRHLLYRDVLSRYPESRLAELFNCNGPDAIFSLCDDYDANRGEFYFDRDPDSFKCMLEAYYYGEIHMKRGLCPICFQKELDFWGIAVDTLDECCQCLWSEKRDELEEIARRVKLILDDRDGGSGDGCWARAQRFLWHLMEKPESSCPARALAILSFLLVLVSSVVMCLSTIPELQLRDQEGQPVEHPTLDSIETACIGWFTAEYLLRLVSAPHRLKFVLSFMNLIDVLAIFPFYVSLVLTTVGASLLELTTVQQAIQALRIMRIARIFKLARHSSGLQTLTYALKSSFKELGLLLMYLAVGIFVFSAIGFTMEQSHPETLFKSIPQSFWWAIITMTTVGYGDIYPKTTLGKLNAAMSFLCGIIAIALPIHPIINNFVRYYNKQRVLETAAKHELELMELNAKCEGQSSGGSVNGQIDIVITKASSGDTISRAPPPPHAPHPPHTSTLTPLLPQEKLHRNRLQSCK